MKKVYLVPHTVTVYILMNDTTPFDVKQSSVVEVYIWWIRNFQIQFSSAWKLCVWVNYLLL